MVDGWMELKRFTVLNDKFNEGTAMVYFKVMWLDRPNKKKCERWLCNWDSKWMH